MTTPNEHGLAVRGVIEGFYGAPFGHAQRAALVRFIGARGYDHYVYAPKNDPLHRARWRDRYSPEELAAFRALATTCNDAGVRFVYAVAPGLSYDAADPHDFERLAAKIASLVDVGAGGIALLFDDLAPDSTTLEPVVQAELIARTADLVGALDPRLAFWFIGNFYCGDAAELRSGAGFWSAFYGRTALEYFAAYERYVPASIPIMWTGPAVFSARVSGADVDALRVLVRRPVVLWDNFPVNDALPGQLFLGPYVGRDATAVRSLHGIVLNLMSQAAANRIPLATAAEFFADPASYDAEAALERAVRQVAADEQCAAALRVLVDQQRGHPVLAASAPARELERRVAAAFDDASATCEVLAGLREHLVALASTDADLRELLRDDPMLAEIAPWSEQLARLARAALLGLEAIDDHTRRKAYEAARDDARASAQLVAATALPPVLLPLVAGQGEPVDRFATLFSAIDRRLGGSSSG